MSSILVKNISGLDIFASRDAKKIVVVCGEYHSWHTTTCGGDGSNTGAFPRSTCVADYFLALAKSKIAKILLEVNPKSLRGETANFVQILQKFQEAGMGRCIRACDVRDLFLTATQKNRLYHGTVRSASPYVGSSLTEALTFLKLHQSRRLSHRDHPGLQPYFSRLHASLVATARASQSTVSQKSLKELWKNIMDFYLLLEILPESSSEIICVLVGERHRANLANVLSGNQFDRIWSQTSTKIGPQAECHAPEKIFRLS